MGIHVTKYETKDGKTTRKSEESAVTEKPGADGKTSRPGTPADKERKHEQ